MKTHQGMTICSMLAALVTCSAIGQVRGPLIDAGSIAFDGQADTRGVAVPPCPGDANGDFQVNFDDLNLVLGNWNTTVTPGTNGDVNNSGFVDFDDLNLVLSNWGRLCIEITDFFPRAGGTCTELTILGRGFDPDPDNNCAVVMMGGPDGLCSLPLQVIDVNPQGTQMRVEVGPIWQGAQPGPIMVGRGVGAFGTFDPVFPEIIVRLCWVATKFPIRSMANVDVKLISCS